LNFRQESLVHHGRPGDSQFSRHQVFKYLRGGAIVSRMQKPKQRIDYLKNFGLRDE